MDCGESSNSELLHKIEVLSARVEDLERMVMMLRATLSDSRTYRKPAKTINHVYDGHFTAS